MEKLKEFLNSCKDLLVLVVFGLTPLIWYGLPPQKFIAGVDSPFPFNPNELIKKAFFLWNDTDGFGHSVTGFVGNVIPHILETILTVLFPSLFTAQLLYVIIWFSLPMVVMYFVMKSIPALADKPYLPFFAALLFQFNLFQLQGVLGLWQTRFSIYVALPIIFLLLINFYEGKRKAVKTVVLIALTLFIFNGGGSPPLYGSLILLFFAVSIYYFFLSSDKKGFLLNNTVFLLLTCITTLLLSAYWVIPYLYYVASSFQASINSLGGSTGILPWVDVVVRNASVLNLLRQQGLDIVESSSANQFIKDLVTHPLPIALSFIWPILAFLSLIDKGEGKEKKYSYLIYILFFLGLVFTAGSHQPFREFFILLTKYIPGYSIFRTTIYKFGGLYWFASAVLIAMGISLIIEKSAKFFPQTASRVFTIFIVSFFVTFIMLMNQPYFKPESFNYGKKMTSLITVPDYVFEFGKWISKEDLIEGRILLFPQHQDGWEAFKWGFSSLTPVTSTLTAKRFLTTTSEINGRATEMLKSLYRNYQNQDSVWRKIADLMDIRYFLLRMDFLDDLSWAKTTSPFLYKDIFFKDRTVKLQKKFGAWELYEVNLQNDNRQMINGSQVVIQTNDSGASIDRIYKLTTQTNSTLLFTDSLESSETREKLARLPAETYWVAECILCQPQKFEQDVNLIKMPYINLLPDSPFYFLVEMKEKKMADRYKGDAGKQIDLKLSLSNKRLSEIDSVLSRNEKGNNLLLSRLSFKYLELIKEVITLRNSLDDKYKANQYGIKILTYFYAQKNFLEILRGKLPDNLDWDLILAVQQATKKISDLSWFSEGADRLRYIVNLNQSGKYNLYIDEYDLFKKRLYLEGEELNSYDNLELEKGVHRLELNLGELPNLVNVATDSALIEFDKNDNAGFRIENFDEQHGYRVKFSYRISGNAPKAFSIIQNNDKINQFGNKTRVVKTRLTADKLWHDYETVFYPNKNAKEAFVEFSNLDLKGDSEPLFISGLQVKKIIIPTLVFYKKLPKNYQEKTKTSWLKMNPTKYLIKVQNAANDYILNFNQSFDKGWRAYVDGQEISAEDHFETNGYANGWLINRRGNYEITIEYYPQKIFYLGVVVSIATMFIITTIYIYKKVYEKN